MKSFFVFVALMALMSTGFSQTVQRLPVTILYESLCPDSQNFIQSQLLPSYHQLQDYIDLYFVPFGKSHSQPDGETFACQHGPRECKGNKLQSCVLSLIKDQPTQVSFVGCQMDYAAEESGKYCSEAVSVPFFRVLECMYSGAGTQMQLAAERETQRWAPRFVPTILYNDRFDQTLQDQSLRDFKGVVCSLINGAAPGC